MEKRINEQQLELFSDLFLSNLCSNAPITQKELEKRVTLVLDRSRRRRHDRWSCHRYSSE
jgi:hypothetical protein